MLGLVPRSGLAPVEHGSMRYCFWPRVREVPSFSRGAQVNRREPPRILLAHCGGSPLVCWVSRSQRDVIEYAADQRKALFLGSVKRFDYGLHARVGQLVNLVLCE